MKKLYTLLILILVFSIHSSAININGSITSGGVTRTFTIHAPGASVAPNLPVVYILHGDGGTGAGIKGYSGFDSIADQNNFIAVYPNAYQSGGLWNKFVDFAPGDSGSGNYTAPDDVLFFSDLTDYLCTTYTINTAKVYATGHSGGAYMCYNLAMQLSNKIAGVAPVAGSLWGSNAPLNALFTSANYKKVPIYHIHGDADATVSYPDGDNTPIAWDEWPFSAFGYYGCYNSTYTSTTNIAGTTNVKRLNFCTGPASATTKEVYLIRIMGGGHGWPLATGYKPALAIWNFFNQYALPAANPCSVVPPSTVYGTVKGGIAGSSISNYIHTSGRYVLGPRGDTVIIRGVNYAPYNWGYDINELNINQIALSNANAVRLVWYMNGGGAPVYPNWVALDSAISKCVQKGLIAIPELHDQTCTNDSVALSNLIGFWTNPAMLNILNKYKKNVIVNFANEALGSGNWGWLGGSASQFKNIYGNIITQLRNVAGFNFPIMIDAPDCGGNEDAIINNSTATYLTATDPMHNIIYSVHAYWPLPTNTSAMLNTRVTAMRNSNIPFVFGEVAATADCSDIILLDSLLKFAKINDIGWLAWSWDRDNCAARQITTAGAFSNLTPYGNTIVNNTQTGLVATAVKILPPLSGPLAVAEIYLQIKNNVLYWTTLNNNIQYNIACSKNNIDWTIVKQNITLNEFEINPEWSIYNYWKIIGNNMESNIVKYNASKSNIYISPNPSTDNIIVNGLNDNFSYCIATINGVVVLNGNNNLKPIDIKSLTNGVYILRIVNAQINKSIIFSKQ
jgi:poly(3-hydroxybutyrate) depolymerase